MTDGEDAVMRSRTATALLLMVVMLAAACGGAAAGSRISVSDARVPVPAGPNGVAYMTLVNDGDTSDRLVAVSSDVAASVELHETTTREGSMSMQPVDDVEIPAGGKTVLEPGGLHVMLVEVDADLVEGDTVDLTLTFEGAGEQTFTADVVPLGDMPGMDMGSEHMEMGSEPMELGSEG